jgi:16S rRNA (uracil1498-N3)-methyltransferase
MARFHIEPADWIQMRLRGDEAHHCTRVLRLRPGALIRVFDGQGREAEARIVAEQVREVVLECVEAKQTAAPYCRITLAQGVPKGKTMDWILEKATELGINRVVPLLTRHTVVQCEDGERKRQKWQRVVLEACKQCGQNWMPEVAMPCTLEVFLRDQRPGTMLVAGSLGPTARPLLEALERVPEELVLLVGPEGDFSPEEMDLLRGAGCLEASFGPLVLRSETAAIFGLSVLGAVAQRESGLHP